MLTALPTPASGAAWNVATDITLRETYSDNVTLSAQEKRSDYVTQITPGIRIDGAGPRFRANFDYRPSAILYAQSTGEDRIAHNLRAVANLEAVEKFFFVEANGAISQGFIAPLGAQPADIITISPNRVETRTFGVSPYIRSQFGSAFTYELRNRNTWTSTNNNALADIHSRQWFGRAASPVRLFGWALEYDDTSISYTTLDRPNYRSKLYRGRLFYKPVVELQLSLSAGREKNNYILQQETAYYIRGAGVQWKPSARTTAEVEYERRYFGPYRLARFDHRTRLTAWTLTYSRNASNYPQDVLRLPPGNTAALLDAILTARIPDPVQRQAAVDQFLRLTGTPAFLANSLAFYTNQIFVQERLEASLGILGKRNSVIFTAFRSENTPLSSGVGTALPDAFTLSNRITLRGFGANVSHNVTPFTTLGAAARRTFARQEEPVSGDSRNDFYSASLTHEVSPKTTTFAGVSYTHFESTPGTDRVNARGAFVGLNHRF